jgi:hypothetical protein
MVGLRVTTGAARRGRRGAALLAAGSRARESANGAACGLPRSTPALRGSGHTQALEGEAALNVALNSSLNKVRARLGRVTRFTLLTPLSSDAARVASRDSCTAGRNAAAEAAHSDAPGALPRLCSARGTRAAFAGLHWRRNLLLLPGRVRGGAAGAHLAASLRPGALCAAIRMCARSSSRAADALRGPKTGVSAGALTATLAACDVDMAVRREPRSGWP